MFKIQFNFCGVTSCISMKYISQKLLRRETSVLFSPKQCGLKLGYTNDYRKIRVISLGLIQIFYAIFS